MTEQKEEVVISGISGLFPECKNVDEFKELLFNKVNGVTIDSRRWKPNTLDAVCGTGKLKALDELDANFFSIHSKLATSMDAMTKLFIERSIEAIIDAGLSLTDLAGTTTAVFSGCTISETDIFQLGSPKSIPSVMLGISRCMQANRISYFLNLTGPSYSMDGAWICGSIGLEKAKQMIEDGIITAAIIGVTNLVLRPELQIQYQGLNRLNRSASTKSFDSHADGYNRSEACVVMLLQKASEAKRSYGTLLNVKSVQFGDHQGHILEHVETNFKSLLMNSYKEVNIDPATVEFIEANGSGIKNEDSMELNVMEEVFCKKQRKTPLKVGSVKSNVGNCEVSGLFVSIIKAIIAFESGFLPPNINYKEPNESSDALRTGKIQVVTEKTAFNGDIIGISSFGLLNAFSHVILKRNNKQKLNYKKTSNKYDLPRLIVASGRNEINTRQTIEKIKKYGNDDEYITLVNYIFTNKIKTHLYKSFSVFPSQEESREDDVWKIELMNRPVWFIFSGMGSQWLGMGLHLMNLPIFADVIKKCDTVLKPLGVDIKNILTNLDSRIFDNILNSFVGIIAVQIGLVEVLKALEITPDGIIGHSVGELGCAYADGGLTLEEAILCAYVRGRVSLETDFIPGMMAAIGLGYHQIKDILPHDIDVACHNSATNCTISGPVDSINTFITELKSKGIFTKAVNVAGIAYHSRYIQSAGPALLKYLKEVIKQPKMRSSKWISSSVPETEWNSELAKYSSPEYHTNNLLSSVLFEDALKHIPSDAIVIEIAPHGLLQAILKRGLPDTVTNIPLTKNMFGDSVRFLFNSIGIMYVNGLNPKIQELYPKVTFPVGRGTPTISSLPFWDHDEKWPSRFDTSEIKNTDSGEIEFKILLNDNIHLMEYQIQGHHVIPLSYVLEKVWKTFNINMHHKTLVEESIQFTNLRFKNNIKIHPTNATKCYLMIQWGSGCFEFSVINEVICTGQIMYIQSKDVNSNKPDSKPFDNFNGRISKDEIYAVFKNNGFHIGENFKNITNVDFYKNNIQGYVKWKNDWIYFLDGLLKFPLLEDIEMRFNEAATCIRQITIDPISFAENAEGDDIHIDYNIITNEITCAGLKVSDVITCPIKLPENKFNLIKMEDQTFIPFHNSENKTIHDFIHASFDIIMEADKLNLDNNNGKLILCIPYHYDDPITKICKTAIEQIIDDKLWIDNSSISWENIKNVTEYDESGRFITVTDSSYFQDTMEGLANKKKSYIFVCSKEKLEDFKYWKVIIQQKHNNDTYLVLMKKKITIDENYIFIKPHGDRHDLNVWKTLQTNKLSESLIYLVSNTEPSEGISTYVNNILGKYKSQNLRFLFILDSNAPDFESKKSFYVDQLSIGLIVNIYKNGAWGSYKRIPLREVTDESLIIKNPVPMIFPSKSNSKLIIKYLGLNFKDLVVEDDTEDELGPLEYSGFVENEKKVMGISSYKQTSKEIKFEPLLSWPVPSTWSLKDAATVPLSYAMCYYVLNVFIPKQIVLKSVLVTSGLHPIGQAAISISLSENYEVYAVVESSQQAEYLSYKFPKLPRSNILVNTKNQFHIQIKMMTKAKGVDIIFNFLSGKAFQTAFETLGCHGMFFHFSKSDMKNKMNLGTRKFLMDTSFTVISSNLLLNESDYNKQIIQRAFIDGLNKGVINPFQCHVSKSPINCLNVFETLRTSFLSNIPERVVLSFDDNYNAYSNPKENVEKWSYQCNPDHFYIIIDHKFDWLDLAEWLVNRGARKIVISVETGLMSITTSKRFDRLISQNISIRIESNLTLQTKVDTLDWLNRLASSNVLGSVFILNQFDEKKIDNLRYAFEELKNQTITTSFICISSTGERICNELKSKGVKALNVSLEGNSLQLKGVTKVLSSLDFLFQKLYTVGSSSIIFSEKNEFEYQKYQQMKYVMKNIFPESLDELYLLNEKFTKEPCFVEVQTRSPRFSQLKSIIPLFVIPGFKPKLMKTFYKKLLYPAFEADLPENICSIDELAETLVHKLKNITDQCYVSLIGESWGGIVALKMAQILESRGTMVTISLIEGDPEIVTSWSESFLSNENCVKKLTTLYNSLNEEFSKYALKSSNEEFQSNNVCPRKMFDDNMQSALNSFRSKLKALVETKPLSNKLLTKVFIFRYERTTQFNVIDMKDYCVNAPSVFIIPINDYKHMMVDMKMIDKISENVIYPLPLGVELSLSDKYKHFYYNVDKKMKLY